MLLLAATLALAADLPPVAPHRPRTHRALVLLHVGGFTALGGALTAAVGGVLLTDPFWHGGEGCGLMMAQGTNGCGTSTFWMGMGVTAVGGVLMVSALPLVIVGLALPRDDAVSAERDTNIRVSVLPGGLLLSGMF